MGWLQQRLDDPRTMSGGGEADARNPFVAAAAASVALLLTVMWLAWGLATAAGAGTAALVRSVRHRGPDSSG